VLWIKRGKFYPGGVKLINRKNEPAEHPIFVGSNVLRLVLKSAFEVQAAWREHSSVIDRLFEQGAQAGRNWHGSIHSGNGAFVKLDCFCHLAQKLGQSSLDFYAETAKTRR